MILQAGFTTLRRGLVPPLGADHLLYSVYLKYVFVIGTVTPPNPRPPLKSLYVDADI